MNQARIVDTSSNYGKFPNGIDFGSIYANFDGIIPRFGVGTSQDGLFDQTMIEVLNSGFPFQTYFIPARPALCKMPIRDQVFRWLDGRGVLIGRPMVDVEPAIYGRNETMLNAVELAEVFDLLRINHPHKATWYSNGNYVGILSWPRFLADYDLLAAQYPWEPWRFREYLDYDAFLRDHAGEKPNWVRGTIYDACTYAWQFTAHGRTPNISRVVPGWYKKDHDFSVSVIERAEFMEKFWPTGNPQPPIDPEPPSEEEMIFIVQTSGLAVRSEPSTAKGEATVLYRLQPGENFRAVDIFAPASGGAAWAKNAVGEWTCITLGATQHMRTA